MTGTRSEVRLLKALAHPIRLKILEVLCQQDECVCHLNALLGKTQPYISQQLAVLRKAGLVEDVRVGQYIYYRVRDGRLVELRALVQEMAGALREEDAAPEPSPYPLESCSCPRCQEAREVVQARAPHVQRTRSRAGK